MNKQSNHRLIRIQRSTFVEVILGRCGHDHRLLVISIMAFRWRPVKQLAIADESDE